MNSIPLALDLLERQIRLATEASNDFEKAAVFAATSVLFQDLNNELGGTSDDIGDQLELIRWYTCALVGYDVDNGQDKTALHVGALGALQLLRGLLKPK